MFTTWKRQDLSFNPAIQARGNEKYPAGRSYQLDTALNQHQL